MFNDDENELVVQNMGTPYFNEQLDEATRSSLESGSLTFPKVVQLVGEEDALWNRSLYLLRGIINQPGLTNAEYEWAVGNLLGILLVQRDPRKNFLRGLLDIVTNHPSQATLKNGGNPQIELIKKRLSLLERSRKNAWFPRARLCVNSEQYVKNVLGLASEGISALSEQATFYILGTCFAANIHAALQGRGINSTYYEHPENLPAEIVISNQIFENEALISAIESEPHPCMVLTLGFAEFKVPDMEDSECQETSFHDFDAFRSPEYISEAILKGVRELQKINQNIRVFLTVSPVPLEGTSSGMNVFEANAISKSIVRLAAAIACNKDSSIQYFPSYEIVTQVAPSAGICPFGEDDGHPRHVNAELVEKICSLFIDAYCPWLG